MFDGLKMWWPRHLIRYFESSETAAVPAKIHHPFMLHQSPCCVPGTRRMKATPLPVRSALAGHMSTCCLRTVIAISSTAQVRSETRIWAIESWKWNPTCPITCSDVIVNGEMQPRVAQLREDDGVRRAPNRRPQSSRRIVARLPESDYD